MSDLVIVVYREIAGTAVPPWYSTMALGWQTAFTLGMAVLLSVRHDMHDRVLPDVTVALARAVGFVSPPAAVWLLRHRGTIAERRAGRPTVTARLFRVTTVLGFLGIFGTSVLRLVDAVTDRTPGVAIELFTIAATTSANLVWFWMLAFTLYYCRVAPRACED